MPADKEKPEQHVATLKLPTEIYNIEFKKSSKNTIKITMDNGWAISMRIHNAATNIENSLKLDVQMIGIPSDQYREILSFK